MVIGGGKAGRGGDMPCVPGPRCTRTVAWCMTAVALFAGRSGAHVFVFEFDRVGAAPAYDGQGWIGEAYLNLPDEAAIHLIAAENYVADREPDFTFRTPWIDFPAGPDPYGFDTDFETIGDYLNDYIYDVSDPSKLDEPFGHFLLIFRGYLAVRLEDDVQLPPADGSSPYGLPVWIEFGTIGFDGYRTWMGEPIYRIPIVNPANPFYHENCIVLGLGLFPIRITQFNRYDPQGTFHMERAGIELYSWHGGGLPWPAGENLVHTERGPATVVPPRVIYQEEDILPLTPGDFDADADVDLVDFQWFQFCYTGPNEGGTLDDGCASLDFDDDNDVDRMDLGAFEDAAASGKGGPP